MKLNTIKVDVADIEAGRWIGNLPEMDDLEVQVRGLDNAAARQLRQVLLRAVPRGRRVDGQLSLDDSDRIAGKVLLETVLLDWRGLEDDDGSPIAYSKDLAKTLLEDPENRKFRDAVTFAASLVGESLSSDEAEEKKA